jgi:hypothetical protein
VDEQWAGYDCTQENDATIQGVMDSPFKELCFQVFFWLKAEKQSIKTF